MRQLTLVLPEIVPGHRADIAERTITMPAPQLLGIRVVGFAPGISVFELPIRPEITFDGHIVQAGIVGMLAD